MLIQIFRHQDVEELQRQVNIFLGSLSSKRVIDIKLATDENTSEVMVIIEDES